MAGGGVVADPNDPFAQLKAQRERMGYQDTSPEAEISARNSGFGDMVAVEARRREQMQQEAAAKALAEREAARPKTSIDLAGDVSQGNLQNAIDQARAIDQSKVNVKVGNPNYAPDKAYTDSAEGAWDVRPVFNQETGEPMMQPVFDEAGNVMRNADGSIQQEMVTEQVWNPGFVEEQARTKDEAGQAGILAERRLNEEMIAQNDATRNAMIDQRAQEMAYDDRLRAQEEAIQKTNEGVAAATQKLTRFADDPWQDKGAGFKTLAVIQGVLSGMVGQDATRVLRQAIDTEMEGLRAGIGAAQSEQNAAMDTYRTLMAETGDQRQADLMMEAARLEAAKAEFLQKQREFNIPVLSAEHQAFLADLDEMIAQKHNAAQRMAATNVPFTTRTVSTMGAEERKVREQMASQGVKTAADATMAGVGQANALELADVKGQSAQQAAAAKGRAETTAKTEMDIKKATDEWGAVENLVSDFLEANPGNIHGVGMPLTGSQIDRSATRSFQSALELLMTSGFTGATATDRQVEQIRNMIEGGTFEMTDDAFRARMNTIKNIASSRRRYYQNQLAGANPVAVQASDLSTFQPE